MLTPDPATYQAISALLYQEAALLDSNRVREWLETVLDLEIVYEIPIRVTRERESDREFSDEAYHLNENRASLETRIARLETEYAWAEDPPSRTRRFVTNITVGSSDDPEAYEVSSNLLVFRSRYDSTDYALIACQRHDVVRRRGSELRIAARRVLLDHTTLPVHNLGIFL